MFCLSALPGVSLRRNERGMPGDIPPRAANRCREEGHPGGLPPALACTGPTCTARASASITNPGLARRICRGTTVELAFSRQRLRASQSRYAYAVPSVSLLFPATCVRLHNWSDHPWGHALPLPGVSCFCGQITGGALALSLPGSPTVLQADPQPCCRWLSCGHEQRTSGPRCLWEY